MRAKGDRVEIEWSTDPAIVILGSPFYIKGRIVLPIEAVLAPPRAESLEIVIFPLSEEKDATMSFAGKFSAGPFIIERYGEYKIDFRYKSLLLGWFWGTDIAGSFTKFTEHGLEEFTPKPLGRVGPSYSI